ncbi:CoA transferase [Vineibacter terrae]|uniref:CaiB/BaiF CoA transferase family protein n=1 Tax=Vineibacter terrae TaxID=2586908 RepID=UPI002E2F95BF|nr:CoA transferase [Vineibacter terrae]HEX2888932.1 CoA transferase [Vineibacter terrae]
MAGALSGVRVLDFTQMMAGPLCPSLLGDLGADVIKIEPPEGDAMRRTGSVRVGGESDLFLSVNRNKRSVVLDLKTPEGQRAARALAAGADVVVENFRPGTAERLGIGYDDIRRENPQVIYCSITGFGRKGPDSGRPALDPVIQALSGLMSLTGDESTGPLLTGMPISDFVAPVFGTVGVLAALYARQRSGHGQRIDLSMLDSSIFTMMPREAHVLATGEELPLLGNRHYQMVPYNAYETRDGRSIMVIAHNDKFWLALLRALDCLDMKDDPRLATGTDRARHRDVVEARFAERFRSEDQATLIARLTQADAIFAPVRGIPEVLADERVRRDMLVRVEHPTAGPVSLLANPLHFSATPATIRSAPPGLGQHTQEVLSRLDAGTAWGEDHVRAG